MAEGKRIRNKLGVPQGINFTHIIQYLSTLCSGFMDKEKCGTGNKWWYEYNISYVIVMILSYIDVQVLCRGYMDKLPCRLIKFGLNCRKRNVIIEFGRRAYYQSKGGRRS
ncbi:MAG: hypothetical protein MRK02_04285 [Candidatus Scalindua sp.]|nr:hypothetical protein [Candidatus Scalindua sp.]